MLLMVPIALLVVPNPPEGARSLDQRTILTETNSKMAPKTVKEVVPPMAAPTNIGVVTIHNGGDYNDHYDFKSSRNCLSRNTLGFDSFNVVYRSKFLQL